MMAYQKRLKKEYEELSMRAPTGISLDQETTEDNIDMLVLAGYILFIHTSFPSNNCGVNYI